MEDLIVLAPPIQGPRCLGYGIGSVADLVRRALALERLDDLIGGRRASAPITSR